MIPFVAAGGLLIALGFLFGGYEIANKPDGATQSLGNIIALNNSLTNLPDGGFTKYLGAVLFSLGGLAFSFLVPALARLYVDPATDAATRSATEWSV